MIKRNPNLNESFGDKVIRAQKQWQDNDVLKIVGGVTHE